MLQHPTPPALTSLSRPKLWPPLQLAWLASRGKTEEGKSEDPSPPSSSDETTRKTPPGGEKSVLEVVRDLDRKDQEELLAALKQILGQS